MEENSEPKVGGVVIDNVVRTDMGWKAIGRTKDFSGAIVELSEVGASREEVQRLLEERGWALVFNEQRFAVTARMTVLELVDIALQALRTGEIGQGNRIQTVNMYQRARRFLVGERGIPALGNLRLEDCEARVVHSWLSRVAGSSLASARHLRILLLHAFSIAERQGLELWTQNPARTAQLPQLPRAEPVEVTPEEFNELLAQILAWESQGKRTDLSGIVCCYMATGIRPGELPALLWEEVDLDSKPATMIVSGCAVYQDGKLVRQPEPKTAAGFREIVIPEWFAEMLRERFARRDPNVPYVFPSRAGTMHSMHNLGNRFRQARGARFKHIKLKSFRSTVATVIAREKGAEEAARHLGHTSPAITGRHYIKRANKTGDHNDILEALKPTVLDER